MSAEQLFFTLPPQTLMSQDDLGDSVSAFVFGANRRRIARVDCCVSPYATCDQILHVKKVEQKARRRIASGKEQKTTSTDDTKSLRVCCKPVRAPHRRTNKA